MDTVRRWLAGVQIRDAQADARAFEELFGQVYLRFHRRDGKRSQLSGASRAVLLHLAMTGPLTVGEMSVHLDRAQSVVSEIVSQLERHGLLEREPDPADRRRTLVWLTDSGQDALRHDREVLATDRLAAVLYRLDDAQRAALIDGLRALVAADTTPADDTHTDNPTETPALTPNATREDPDR